MMSVSALAKDIPRINKLKQGWNNPQGDNHFKIQRQRADEASYQQRQVFYNLMHRIGDELQSVTGTLALPKSDAEILDLCMAPGGYSVSALKYSPHARVSGLTLPESLGGHQLLIPWGHSDPRVEVQFIDITMLAAEFGVRDVPANHPDASEFSFERPWVTKAFDLVFCDGQVLRAHANHISEYRETCEATRLMCSQLILAMQRIKPGGTFIMLLHKVEMWRTVELLSFFDRFSHVELFKPTTGHKTRSSFYLVAKDVQPYQPEALHAVKEWKASWKNATFRESAEGFDAKRVDLDNELVRDKEVSSLVENFGKRLIELGEPIWRIQKDALRQAPWFKKEGSGTFKTES